VKEKVEPKLQRKSGSNLPHSRLTPSNPPTTPIGKSLRARGCYTIPIVQQPQMLAGVVPIRSGASGLAKEQHSLRNSPLIAPAPISAATRTKPCIGTTAPAVPLDVAGTCATLSAVSPQYYFYGNNAPASTTWSTCTTIRASGSIVGSGFFASSDRRLKTDITDLKIDETALKFITESRPVHFKWKDSGIPNYGFIAQDLIKMGLPELVTALPDKDNKLLVRTVDQDGSVSVAGMKMSVNYNELTALLTQSVKYIYAQVEKLVSQVKDLVTNDLAKDRRIQSLEIENAAIKTFLCTQNPTAVFCKKE
jgi:hypothetical protein